MRLTRAMQAIAIHPDPKEIQEITLRSVLAGAYAHARVRRNRTRADRKPNEPCGVSRLAMRAARAADREDKRAQRLAQLAAKRRGELAPP